MKIIIFLIILLILKNRYNFFNAHIVSSDLMIDGI